MTVELTEERMTALRNQRNELHDKLHDEGVELGKAWAASTASYVDLQRVAALASSIDGADYPLSELAAAWLDSETVNASDVRDMADALLDGQADEGMHDSLAVGFVAGAAEVFELV